MTRVEQLEAALFRFDEASAMIAAPFFQIAANYGYDARTGKKLWSFNAKNGMIAPPITYTARASASFRACAPSSIILMPVLSTGKCRPPELRLPVERDHIHGAFTAISGRARPGSIEGPRSTIVSLCIDA